MENVLQTFAIPNLGNKISNYPMPELFFTFCREAIKRKVSKKLVKVVCVQQ